MAIFAAGHATDACRWLKMAQDERRCVQMAEGGWRATERQSDAGRCRAMQGDGRGMVGKWSGMVGSPKISQKSVKKCGSNTFGIQTMPINKGVLSILVEQW